MRSRIREIYRTACEVIQAVPEETVALEDAPAGVKSASGQVFGRL